MQGMGNFVNACVIAVCMAIFGETGKILTVAGSRSVVCVMYGVGAATCLIMVTYRLVFLQESVVGGCATSYP